MVIALIVSAKVFRSAMKDPYRMPRVRQPFMRQCVAQQQVAEFVMDAGDCNWKCRQQQDAKSDDHKEQHPTPGRVFL